MVNIKEVVIQINKKEIHLSLDEVKDLRSKLNQLIEYQTYPIYPSYYPAVTYTGNGFNSNDVQIS